MKKRTKVLLLLLSAVLLVVASVMGTLAYLTSQDTVTNTFTVGKVKITMAESKVNENGVAIPGTTTDSNAYKLIPGHEYDKDPKITVEEGSEACWLFVEVDNGIEALEDTTNTISSQILANGWSELSDVDNVYYKEWSTTDSRTINVFEKFYISDDAQGVDGTWRNGLSVNVTAYAIQKDTTLDNAKIAWTKLNAQLTP